MDIRLEPVPREQAEVLARLWQLYCHDFSEFQAPGDGLEVDERGLFDTGWLTAYWQDPGRSAFFILADGRLAGFALVSSHHYLPGHAGARQLAEFFVLRGYRLRGVGRRAAWAVFDAFPGLWEVFQTERNLPATRFWRKVISAYTGGVYGETRLDTPNRRGPLQFFRAPPHEGLKAGGK